MPEPVAVKRLRVRDKVVEFPDGPVLDCRFADRLGQWTSDLVIPVIFGGLGTELKAVRTGPNRRPPLAEVGLRNDNRELGRQGTRRPYRAHEVASRLRAQGTEHSLLPAAGLAGSASQPPPRSFAKQSTPLVGCSVCRASGLKVFAL